MIPPPDLVAESDQFEPRDRSRFAGLPGNNEDFKLGPYELVGVKRWGKSERFADLLAGMAPGSTRTEIRDDHSFQFKEGPEKLTAQCTALTVRKSWLWKFQNSRETRLTCTCGSGDQAVTLELVMENMRVFRGGSITLPRATLDLAAVHETNAFWWFHGPAGFRVDEGRRPLGAVEILPPGSIWLSRSLDGGERRQIGCLLASLMLYEHPADEDEDED